MTDVSPSEGDLVFTPRALGRVDRRAWRGRGVSTFMIRSFRQKWEAPAPLRRGDASAFVDAHDR